MGIDTTAPMEAVAGVFGVIRENVTGLLRKGAKKGACAFVPNTGKNPFIMFDPFMFDPFTTRKNFGGRG